MNRESLTVRSVRKLGKLDLLVVTLVTLARYNQLEEPPHQESDTPVLFVLFILPKDEKAKKDEKTTRLVWDRSTFLFRLSRTGRTSMSYARLPSNRNRPATHVTVMSLFVNHACPFTLSWMSILFLDNHVIQDHWVCSL